MFALLEYHKQEINHDGWKITKDSRKSIMKLCKGDDKLLADTGEAPYVMSDIIQGIFHVFWMRVDGEYESLSKGTFYYVYYKNGNFVEKTIENVCYMYHDSNGIYLGELHTTQAVIMKMVRVVGGNDPIEVPRIFENETDYWTILGCVIYRHHKNSGHVDVVQAGTDFVSTRFNNQLFFSVHQNDWVTSDWHGNLLNLVATALVPKQDYYQILDTSFSIPKITLKKSDRAWFDGKYLYIHHLGQTIDIYAYPSPDMFCYLTDKAKKIILLCLWILKVHPTLKKYVPKRLLIEKILPLFIGEIVEK